MSDRWFPNLFGGPRGAEPSSLKKPLSLDRLEDREAPCATCGGGLLFGRSPVAMVGPPVFAYSAGQQQSYATGLIPPPSSYGFRGQWGSGWGWRGMSSAAYSMYGGGSYSAAYQQLLSLFYSRFASSSSYGYGGGFACQLAGLRMLAMRGI